MSLQLTGEEEESVIMVGVGEVEVGAVGCDAGDGTGQVVAEGILEVLPQLPRIADGAEVQDEGEQGAQAAAGRKDGGLLEGGGPLPILQQQAHGGTGSAEGRVHHALDGPEILEAGGAGPDGEQQAQVEALPLGGARLEHAADRLLPPRGCHARFSLSYVKRSGNSGYRYWWASGWWAL